MRFTLLALVVATPAMSGEFAVEFTGPVFVPTPTTPSVSSPFVLPESGAATSGGGGGQITAAAAERAVRAINEVTLFCAPLEPSYRVDCLADGLASAARELSRRGDLSAARGVLEKTSRDLAALARANADPDQPRGRASRAGQAPRTSSRPLTPVRPEAQASVNAQALAIIEEAETVLLRSAGFDSAPSADLRTIAEAVGSTKVLLRS